MVNENSNFIRSFNVNDFEADILGLFLVHSYGNAADFRTYLQTQARFFNLGSYLCKNLENDIETFQDDLDADPTKIGVHEYANKKSRFNDVTEDDDTNYKELARKLLALNGLTT